MPIELKTLFSSLLLFSLFAVLYCNVSMKFDELVRLSITGAMSKKMSVYKFMCWVFVLIALVDGLWIIWRS